MWRNTRSCCCSFWTDTVAVFQNLAGCLPRQHVLSIGTGFWTFESRVLFDLVKRLNANDGTCTCGTRLWRWFLSNVVLVGSSIAFETRPHTHTQTVHLLLTDPESKYRVFIYFTEPLLPCLVRSWLIRCWFAKTVCYCVCVISDSPVVMCVCVSERPWTGCVKHENWTLCKYQQ